MADDLFIKHNLGSFQQPYIFQSIGQGQEPNIRRVPAPYPYIANAQNPAVRRQPAPYPYIANAQEPNIRDKQEPNIRDGQTPNIGSTQQPGIGTTQNTVSVQNTRSKQSPFTYPYQATYNFQQPNTYRFPQPYPFIGSSRVPHIRRQPAPYPFIGSTQEPNIRSKQEPNIRDQQHPFIRNKQQPNDRQRPAPYPYIANRQNPFERQQPARYPYIASSQQPNERSKQSPAIGQTRSPFTYNIQQPTAYQVRTPVIRTRVVDLLEEDIDWESDDDGIVPFTTRTWSSSSSPDLINQGIELKISVTVDDDYTIYWSVREFDQNLSSGYQFYGESQVGLTSSFTTIGSMEIPFQPDGFRLVVVETNSVTNTGQGNDIFVTTGSSSTNDLSTNYATSLTATGSFNSFTSGTWGANILGNHSHGRSTSGGSTSQVDADIYIQFAESGFSNFTHVYALPFRSILDLSYNAPSPTPQGSPGFPNGAPQFSQPAGLPN